MSRVGPILRSLGYVPEVVKLQEAVNHTEGDFLATAAAKRHGPFIRHGWPDFLVKLRDGRWVGVEVKATLRQRLRKSQREAFAVLEQLGVDVYVWTPQGPDSLIPWRQFKGRQRVPRPRRGQRGSRG